MKHMKYMENLQHKKLVEKFMPSIGLNILILIESYLTPYGMRKL